VPEPQEDERERVNRELIELLNELRVALPGVQVLFAFLLTVPFSQRFSDTTPVQRGVYYGAFVCAALATALLIAPSSYHRMHFRRRDKERMLLASNKLAISGLAFLALSVGGVVFVISDVLYHVTVAAVVTAAISVWFAWFWYGLALSRRSPPD
jgi:VIT1/CCC1 family predicted Fe2+/Mn2+ transporter